MQSSPKAGASGDGVRSSRSAPFSMHARGVQLLDWNRFIDVPLQLQLAYSHLRDLGSSLYTFLLLQSWLSVYNLLLTIASCAFYTYYRHDTTANIAFYQDWTLVCFVVVLPTLGLVWAAYSRREQALRDVAEVKPLLLHIYLAHRDWVPAGTVSTMHHASVQQLLFTFVDCMRAYFLPPRFYTRHYPYTGVKNKMMRIAQERAKQVRRITANFKKLSRSTEVLRKGGLGDAQLTMLAEFNLRLQCAFERMAAVKEYRTPQGLRALARFYMVVFIPLFFGPYYAELHNEANSFAFPLFFAMLLHLAVVGLLNVSIALEDPFDNNGLDGTMWDEALFEAEQAIAMDEDAELAGSAELLPRVGTGVPQGAMLTPADHKRPGQTPPSALSSPRHAGIPAHSAHPKDVVLDVPAQMHAHAESGDLR